MTRSLILFVDPLTLSLELAGSRVFEALAISEVLHLYEHESIDCVVIAPDGEDEADKEMSWHVPIFDPYHRCSALHDGLSNSS